VARWGASAQVEVGFGEVAGCECGLLASIKTGDIA
jgi:hypothetical protein